MLVQAPLPATYRHIDNDLVDLVLVVVERIACLHESVEALVEACALLAFFVCDFQHACAQAVSKKSYQLRDAPWKLTSGAGGECEGRRSL